MSATTLLAAGDLATWGAVTMTITGSADWDTELFAELKAGTLTESAAKALWTYTDGYQVKIAATTTSEFNPNSVVPYLETTRGLVVAGKLWNEYEYAVACSG
jgi:hypothetical protein